MLLKVRISFNKKERMDVDAVEETATGNSTGVTDVRREKKGFMGVFSLPFVNEKTEI